MISKAGSSARSGAVRARAAHPARAGAKRLVWGFGAFAMIMPPLLLYPAASVAQQTEFPTRPLRIIVGFTPASSTDILARFIGTNLAERLNQTVVVDNRPGANGAIGADLTAKATPDGHTLLLMSASHTMNAAVNPRLPFDAVKSFVPIAMIGAGPLVLVANPSFPASNVRSLIELAKVKSKSITYGSAGTAGINHFGGALFAHTAGIELTHVPYKGGAPALTDVMGGHVQLMFGSMPLTVRQVRAGKIKALGVTGAKRSPLLPEVPAIAESLPGYEISTWWGIIAPAGVPAPVVATLNKAISGIVVQPESVKRLEAEGAAPWPLSSAEFGRVIQSQLDKWRRVSREANIRAE